MSLKKFDFSLFRLNKRFLSVICYPGIYGVYGKPRAGKTTLSAAVVCENNRRRNRYLKLKNKSNFIANLYRRFRPFFDRIYCTDETIKGTYHISYKDFGKWNVKDNSLIICEEAGIGFDSREWSKFSEDQKRLCAYIGHKKSTILWSSQSADVWKSLRIRSHKLFLVSKFLGNLSLIRPIDYEFGVDNETGEMKDKYHIPEKLGLVVSVLRRETFLFNRKPYYKYFDSFVDNHKYSHPDPADLTTLSF